MASRRQPDPVVPPRRVKLRKSATPEDMVDAGLRRAAGQRPRCEWAQRNPDLTLYHDDVWGETPADVKAGWALAAEWRRRLRDLCEDGEILVTPPATGEAPTGLASTGSSIFCRSWTLLGVPCLQLPVADGPSGLPLGIQLVAPRGDEGALFGAAAWLDERLKRAPVR